MRRADALSPASKAFSTSLGSVWKGFFFAFFRPFLHTAHSSVRLCCTPSSASCLPVCHSNDSRSVYNISTDAALYPASPWKHASAHECTQPCLKPAAWAMPQPPGGPAPAQQGVACWQHNNRTEARTGLLRCGRQGGKSAGQHWLLVLALPTRKLPLGEIVPHGSLHLASSKKSISAIFLNW